MVYEDICNFGMDQLVITQYKKILKILQENSNILILKIPIEKVKSKEEKESEELQTKNCLIFKKLEKFFLERSSISASSLPSCATSLPP